MQQAKKISSQLMVPGERLGENTKPEPANRVVRENRVDLGAVGRDLILVLLTPSLTGEASVPTGQRGSQTMFWRRSLRRGGRPPPPTISNHGTSYWSPTLKPSAG